MSGVGTPTCTTVPARSRRVERLLEHLGSPDRLDAHVGAVAVGELADPLDGVFPRRVDRVGRAELLRPLELPGVGVDRDDRARADQARPGDRGVADASAAEHGDGVVSLHTARVHHRTEAGHDTAPEQAGGLGPRRGIDLRRLPRGDQCLLGERADAEGGGERCAVGQRHLLARVVGREAVPRLPAPARPALAADRAPVQDDEVAGRDAGHVGADGFDRAGRLVTEEVREVVTDPALAVVQVGVADAARLHLHERLARPGVGDDDRLDADGLALPPSDDAAHLVAHARTLPLTPSRVLGTLSLDAVGFNVPKSPRRPCSVRR